MSRHTKEKTLEPFQPLVRSSYDSEKISGPSLSFSKDAWRRFKQNKFAMAGAITIIIMSLMAIFGPMLTGYSYQTNNLANAYQAPSGEHWFGTDELGRDLFTRTWHGARVSLFIGLSAAVIDLIVGVVWGLIAGFFGGKIDEIMMRIADILYGIPYLLIVILLMVVLPQGLFTLILAMSITGWISMARIVRGQAFQLKNSEYVLAAQTLGASTYRILSRHLFPNMVGIIIVTMTLTIPTAIFTEAFLSFLGLGVPAPLASWGTMTSDGLSSFEAYPWVLFIPATLICLVMLAFNVIGDGLRDALDPQERK